MCWAPAQTPRARPSDTLSSAPQRFLVSPLLSLLSLSFRSLILLAQPVLYRVQMDAPLSRPVRGPSNRSVPAFVLATPPLWLAAVPLGGRRRARVPADHFILRPALAVGRRATAPAAMAMSDDGSSSGNFVGGGGGDNRRSVQDAQATAPRDHPSYLTCPAPASAETVTQGTMHGWAHPTLQPDGRFYGLAGEWANFGPSGDPRRELSATAMTRTRVAPRLGARVWAHQSATGEGATDLLHINLSASDPGVGKPATLRDTDGLYEKRWEEASPEDPTAGLPAPLAGDAQFLFTASGGGVWGFLGGPPDNTAPFFELFLRGDAAAGWSIIVAWNSGFPHPVLASSIRESRVDGWAGVDGGPVELPAVSPATAPLPVDEWERGYPGPTEAEAGSGTATVTALVGSGDDGGDGRRLVSWTVTDGVRWTPAMDGDGVGDAGTRRVAALEDGLYLSVMADARSGGVIEFGSATPPRAGQCRQRTLLVLEPGAVFSRVVHEVYPPPGGSPAA